jgi:hypothetical protein
MNIIKIVLLTKETIFLCIIVPGHSSSTSPENLSEIQTPPHPKPTEAESSCYQNPHKDMLQFENTGLKDGLFS